MKLRVLIIVLLAMFAFSCTDKLTNVNSATDMNYWTPKNLTITPLSPTSIMLSWEKVSGNYQGFKISRKVGSGAWQEDIATVGVNVTEWLDNNAPYGTTYSYRVKVFAGDYYSNYVEKGEKLLFSTPRHLSITPHSATSLKLIWTDTNQFEQGYKISRKVGDGDWEDDIATVVANSTAWIDDNAPYGAIYAYRVKAYAGDNYSNYVERNQVFILSAPTNLLVNPQTATSLKLTWTGTNQFEEGYKISRRVADGDWEDDIATVDANDSQWTDNTINSTQIFQYRVRAYYQSDYSDYSNINAYLPNFVFVQGGTFQMGSSSGDSYEQPVHSVTLSPFYINKYETTQAEWQTVMTGNNNGISPTPSYFFDYPNRPVERVNWYAALVFCNRKSIQEGLTPCYAKNGDTNPNNWGIAPVDHYAYWYDITCNWSADGYRLPTEAEWEYAARGGNQSNNYTYSGSNNADDVAWHDGNSSYRTHDVGTKAPNELGIYDMSGNVYEWCWDWYSSSYYSSSPANNPTGPSSGSGRVDRGGSWYNHAYYCRVANRGNYSPGDSYNGLGLRVLRTIQ